MHVPAGHEAPMSLEKGFFLEILKRPQRVGGNYP